MRPSAAASLRRRPSWRRWPATTPTTPCIEASRSISRCSAERLARRPPTFLRWPSSRTGRPASLMRLTACRLRQRVATTCSIPPGFSFENYDGDGLYRTTDANQPVDSTGSLRDPGERHDHLSERARPLAQLAQSAEAQTASTASGRGFMLGRPETTAESGSMSIAYQKAAATAGFSLRDLMSTLIQSKAFMYRQPSPGESL